MNGLDRLPASDPTGILRYRDGIYAVDLLTAAITEFRFFDHLKAHPGTLTDLCRHFGWDERPADVLLTLCLCHGLVDRDVEGVFTAGVKALEHLCGDSPWDLSPYYASLRNRPVVEDFVRVLKSGRPAHWRGLNEADDDWHGAMLKEEFANTFTGAMDCRGVYLGRKLVETVADLLPSGGKLLDVGGGSGVYACAFAAGIPDLRAVVLEQAPVDGIARSRISERGLSDRVDVATGDMFDDPWPTDCQVHLFSNVMHDWGAPEISRLLKHSREAIGKGGLILVHEAFLDADKRGPLPVAEYSCILVHATQGRCYSVAEMRRFLEEAGFNYLEHRNTGGDRSVVIATVPG